MKILNYGSLNLDYVYQVSHIAKPGETLASGRLDVFPGGKGLNQSAALARAGAQVWHAGMIGEDGMMLKQVCMDNGIHAEYIRTVPERSGNAIIQVAENGENSIVLFGGANRANKEEYVDEVLAAFGAGDILLLQNEINLNEYLIQKAWDKGMRIVLNPSPYNRAIADCDLSKIHMFFINEVEGEQITGKVSPEEILDAMKKRYPQAAVVLTLGANGAVYDGKEGRFYQKCWPVSVVDTTAAGDTFTGYFMHLYFNTSKNIQEVLELTAKAAAISVSRSGAVPSIPFQSEVFSL